MTQEEKKLFNEKLHVYGFKESDLTEEEAKQLLEEVRTELAGGLVLDGVLFNKPLYEVKKLKE